MTPASMEARVIGITIRYERLGGHAGSIALVCQPGRWSVTSSGGKPALRGTGETPDDALLMAEAALTNMEKQHAICAHHAAKLAQTLGV